MARLGLLTGEAGRLTLQRARRWLLAIFDRVRADDYNHDLAGVAAMRLPGIQPGKRFLKRSARNIGV
jgi:hypothetical protein